MKKAIAFVFGFLIAANAFCQKIDKTMLDSAIIVADRIITTDNRVFFKNVESIIVNLQGDNRFEKYYNGFSKDSLHHIQSQTKSIVSLLMGIAIDRGFIKDENEPVSRYFPQYFKKEDTLKSSVTIKHLLTMSAGFKWEEMTSSTDAGNDNLNMFNSGDWLKYALSRPIETKPFTEFNYNSGYPMIVAGIIEKSAKMTIEEFAKKYLFEPLGINEYRWLKDSKGFCHAGGGLFLKPGDMLKIGMLVMNNGNFKNRQLISDGWINKTMCSYLPTDFDISTYGYFWWLREMRTGEGKTTKVISAEGAGGQRLYLFPEYQLIIAFTERNYSTPLVSPMFITESVLPLLK